MRNDNSAPQHPRPHSDRIARLVLDSATDFAIISMDLNGLITSWNPGAEHVLGWSEAEIVGQPACTFFTDEDRDQGVCGREMAIATHKGRAEDERWHRRKDGSRFWASGLMMRFEAEDSDEHIGYIKILRDRTAQHVAEQNLCESREQLEAEVSERTAALIVTNAQLRREIEERQQIEETLRQAQKMEAVGQLTGGVAHDFNNLLTIIRGSTDLLRRPGITEDKRQRYIDAISNTVDRATALTGQLLAFARRQPLKPQIFSLDTRLRSIDDILRSPLGSRAALSIDIAPGTWLVMADPAQFDTAILNLTVNARDAMPDGGTLSIVIRNADEIPARRGHEATAGEFVAVTVRDTGTGIADALLDRIFEPFFTTKEIGKGTGLGLSQVIGFAKQTGGDILAESHLGQGSSFTLYVPRSHDMVPEEATPIAEIREHHGQGCILVVEDNAQVGEFATQMLQDLGYGTTFASDAQIALEMLAERPDRFDAVFSDVMMPGMNGIELAQRLRHEYPGLPVILASGYSQVLAQEGSHGFKLLQKPYSIDTLSDALGRMLATSSRNDDTETGNPAAT